MAKEKKEKKSRAEKKADKAQLKASKPQKHKRPRTYGEMLAMEREREQSGQTAKRSIRPARSTQTAQSGQSASSAAKVKVKRPNIDPIFLTLLCMLIGTGILMMFSASYANATYYEGDGFFYIKKQVLFACIGFVGMYVASRINYKSYKKLPLPEKWMQKPFWQKVSTSFPLIFYIFTEILLVITLFMPERNYAHRWIIIGPITFQPSDIMKFAVILFCAAWVDRYYKDIKAHSFKYGVLPYVAILIPIAAVMLNQTHVSGTIIIFLIVAVMMLIGGTKLGYFIALGIAAVGGIAGIVAVKGVGYVQDRLNGWLDPMADISDKTWQTVQSLVCIATGGFWGKGFGNSSQKYLFLPEPQNDFVFAIVCEELGLIGAMVVMIMFGLLIWRGYSIARRAKDRFGFMLCAGIISQIAIQVILNIAVVSNAMPNTGVSLPFFSYGGTSLCILMAEMGVVLNISRSANMMKT